MVSAYSSSVPAVSEISTLSDSDNDSSMRAPTKLATKTALFKPDPSDIIPEDFARLKAPNNAFVKSVFINRGTMRDSNVAINNRHNSTNFFTMINYVYANCNEQNRGLLRRFLKNTTTINVSELDVKTRGRNKGQQRAELSESAYTENHRLPIERKAEA